MFGKSMSYLRENALNIVSIGKSIDEGSSVVNRLGLFVFQVEIRSTYKDSDYYSNNIYLSLTSKKALAKAKRDMIFSIIDWVDQDD